MFKNIFCTCIYDHTLLLRLALITTNEKRFYKRLQLFFILLSVLLQLCGLCLLKICSFVLSAVRCGSVDNCKKYQNTVKSTNLCRIFCFAAIKCYLNCQFFQFFFFFFLLLLYIRGTIGSMLFAIYIKII